MRAQSQQAMAAKEIRAILKKNFPTTKFSVTSEGYSMGDNVTVRWTDGPTYDTVHDLIAHYQYGHFDGMDDSYECSNRREDIPQTKYLFCDREASRERRQIAVDWLNKNTSIECYITEQGYVEGPYSSEWGDHPSAIVHRMVAGYYATTRPEMDFSK